MNLVSFFKWQRPCMLYITVISIILTIAYYTFTKFAPISTRKVELKHATEVGEVPKYGNMFPRGQFADIIYMYDQTDKSTYVRMTGSKSAYENLCSRFSHLKTPIGPNKCTRSFSRIPEIFWPRGDEVFIFEGRNTTEREHSTYYYISNQLHGGDSSGTVIIHFR